MFEAFDIQKYRNYLENYHRYPYDETQERALFRKEMISKLDDVYLQQIIDNTKEITLYILKQMAYENNVYDNVIYIRMNLQEKEEYIDNNCIGGGYCDILYNLENNGFFSIYLLRKALKDFNIYISEELLENYNEKENIGSFDYYKYISISTKEEIFKNIYHQNKIKKLILS